MVISLKTISEENHRIRRIVFTFTNDRGYSKKNLIDAHHCESSTEYTIVKHSDPDALVTERFLVMKNKENYYPTNPTNGYIIQWADIFNDCLACSSNTRKFSTCAQKDDTVAK